MKKSVEISAHIFFWIVFIAFAYMLVRIYLQADPDAQFSHHQYYVVFLELVMGLIIFYTTFFGVQVARKNRTNLLILIIVLLSLLVFFAYPAIRHGIWQLMSSLIPHIIIIFLALIFRKFSDSLKLEKEKQYLQLQNVQNELALLKMQISPHFLFNTLNNIDYLILHDTVKASNSISRLGDILRYMIYDGQAERIPLSDEIRHIEDYIELIRLRTSGKNYLNYRFTGNAANLQIAPMLFLPLIENAYKHSSAKEGENIISIKINIEKNSLSFNIGNEYENSPVDNTSGPGGIGLIIVTRRLELIYHDNHIIKVSRSNSRYNVELTLMLDEN
jgi:LytS/YehU family sensor histidine kinase